MTSHRKKTTAHHSELQQHQRRRLPRRLLDMATPGVGPPSYPFSQPPSYRSHQGAGTPSAEGSELGGSGSFWDIDPERMGILVKNFRGSIGVLYSEKSTYYKQLASNVKGYYSTTLYFAGTEIINYDDPNWLDTAARHTHLIFIGIPQTKKRGTAWKGKSTSLDSTTREETFMSRENRKLSTVVVINPTLTRGKTERKGHFLERFVHLPLQQSGELLRLAQTAFAIFSGKKTSDLLYCACITLFGCRLLALCVL